MAEVTATSKYKDLYGESQVRGHVSSNGTELRHGVLTKGARSKWAAS